MPRIRGRSTPRISGRGRRSRPGCRGMTSTPGSTWISGGSRRASGSGSRTGRASPTTELVFHVYPRYRVQDAGPGDPVEDAGGAPAQPRGGDGHAGAPDGGRRGPGRGPGRRSFAFDPEHRHDHDRPARSRRSRRAQSVDGRDRLHARAARLLGALGAPSRDHLSAELVSGPGAPRRRAAGSGRRSSPGTSPGIRRRGITRSGSTCPRARWSPRRAGSPEPDASRAGPAARDDRRQPVARLRAGLLRPVRDPRTPRRRDAGPGGLVPRAPGQRRADPRLRRRGHPALRALVRPLLRRRVRDRPLVLRLERQRVLGARAARRPGDAAAVGGRALPRPPGHARDLPPVVLERRRDRRLRRDVHGRGARQRLHRAAARRQVRPERPADRLAAGPELAADDRPRGPPAGGLLRLAGQGQRRAGDPGPQGDGQPRTRSSAWPTTAAARSSA